MAVSKFSTFLNKILSPYKFFTRFCSHYGIFGRSATTASVGPSIEASGGCDKKPACPPPKPACPPPKPACPPPCPPPKPKCPPEPDPCKKKCTTTTTSKPEHYTLLFYTRNTCRQRLRKPLIGRYTLDTTVSFGEPEVVKKSIIACTKTEILLREVRHYCSNDSSKKPAGVCSKCLEQECKCGAKAPIPLRDLSCAEKKKIDTYFQCYKAKEYYMYGPCSYYDMMSHLTRHHLPQPVAK